MVIIKPTIMCLIPSRGLSNVYRWLVHRNDQVRSARLVFSSVSPLTLGVLKGFGSDNELGQEDIRKQRR